MRIANDGRPTFMTAAHKTRQDAARHRTAPDLTIAPEALHPRWAQLLDWGSDHVAILSELQLRGPLCPRAPTRLKWALKNADWAGFERRLEAELEEPLPDGANADRLNKAFTAAVLEAARAHIGL
eukprot:gene5109-221_t